MTTSCPTNRQAMNSVWYTVYIIGSQGAVSLQPCWWNRMETVYQHKEEGSPCLKLSNAVWGWRRRKGSKPVLRLRAKKKENQDVYWSKTLYSAVIRTSQPKVHRLIGLRQQKCRVETLRLKQQLDIRSIRKKSHKTPVLCKYVFLFFHDTAVVFGLLQCWLGIFSRGCSWLKNHGCLGTVWKQWGQRQSVLLNTWSGGKTCLVSTSNTGMVKEI